MSKRTRCAITLWPYEISCVFTDNEFHSTKPPTNEEAFAKFKGVHDSLQIISKRQSTVREAALKTVTEIMKWWTQAGYSCQSTNALTKKILRLNDQWKELNKQKKKRSDSGKRNPTANFLNRVEEFKKMGKQTFWEVTKTYEEYLSEISNASRLKDASVIEKMKQDLEFLENMRKPERSGGTAGFDRAYFKKMQKKTSKSTSIQEAKVPATLSSEEGSSTDDEKRDVEMYQPPLKRKKQTKPINKQTMTKSNLISDMSGISVRNQFQYTAQLLSSAGMDINEISLFKSTLHRQRKDARISKESEIFIKNQELLRNGEWNLHWDGKTLNPLTHASEKTHIIAVLMTSVNTDNEVLLDIAEMPTDGKKSSTEECNLILSSLKNHGVDFDRVIGVVFDTTPPTVGFIMVL